MKEFINKYGFNSIIISLVAVHLFLLLKQIFFPYPELFVYSYLNHSGLLPYKEIFDQHFPGIMFLPVNLFSLGINNLEKMRLVHLGLIVVNDIVFAKVAQKLFKKRNFVYISLALYIIWQIYFEGHVLWLESFITPLLLLSFYSLIKYEENEKNLYLYLTTFFIGISFVFKQTVAPIMILIFLYLFMKKHNPKKIFVSGILSVIPIIIVIFYFYKLGIFSDFFYWTTTFNLTEFAQMGKTHPKLTDLAKLLPSFGMSIAGILIFIIDKKKIEKYLLLTIYFIGTLFFAYARFDYIHLQPALPYVIFICTYLLFEAYKRIFWGVFLYIAISLYVFLPYYRFNNHPGLSPMFNDRDTLELVNKISKYHKNGDKLYALGTYPHIYYLTNTLPPGGVFTFQFPWFMKISEKRILRGIINDPPQLVLRDENSEVDGYRLIDFMKDINAYINENYVAVDRVKGTEILVKI